MLLFTVRRYFGWSAYRVLTSLGVSVNVVGVHRFLPSRVSGTSLASRYLVRVPGDSVTVDHGKLLVASGVLSSKRNTRVSVLIFVFAIARASRWGTNFEGDDLRVFCRQGRPFLVTVMFCSPFHDRVRAVLSRGRVM